MSVSEGGGREEDGRRTGGGRGGGRADTELKTKHHTSMSGNYGKSQFLMGKSTISTGPFSIAMLNYQRVSYRSM